MIFSCVKKHVSIPSKNRARIIKSSILSLNATTSYTVLMKACLFCYLFLAEEGLHIEDGDMMGDWSLLSCYRWSHLNEQKLLTGMDRILNLCLRTLLVNLNCTQLFQLFSFHI